MKDMEGSPKHFLIYQPGVALAMYVVDEGVPQYITHAIARASGAVLRGPNRCRTGRMRSMDILRLSSKLTKSRNKEAEGVFEISEALLDLPTRCRTGMHAADE